jgi:uncharacterized protein
LAIGLTLICGPIPGNSQDRPLHGSVKSPVTANESLKHFQLDDDFEMELVAAEPEIVDPISLQIDERGRIWVVEMAQISQ